MIRTEQLTQRGKGEGITAFLHQQLQRYHHAQETIERKMMCAENRGELCGRTWAICQLIGDAQFGCSVQDLRGSESPGHSAQVIHARVGSQLNSPSR